MLMHFYEDIDIGKRIIEGIEYCKINGCYNYKYQKETKYWVRQVGCCCFNFKQYLSIDSVIAHVIKNLIE